jgi:diaminopimelate decarboxylase/aspartate kinase
VVDKQCVRRVGADAGMNALLRVPLYSAWHRIENLSRLDEAPGIPVDIVGPVCESSDVLGRQRRLPDATAEGDVLVVAHAGAYCASMGNRYNLRDLPAEDVIDD